ncbi:MAG: hypothetical protein WBE76_17175 [Terracidiphilus sp.]
MAIHIELSPEVGARLSSQAVVRGMALEAYASKLLQEAVAPHGTGTGVLTPDELRTMLREVAEGAENLPKLPTSAFSRESFYEDRD